MDIFKLTVGNDSLHQDINDNGVRIVNVATSKNLIVKSTMFPHRNIPGVYPTSTDGKTHNQIDHTGDGNRVFWKYEVSGELNAILISI